ncbi:MAG: phosphoadenylyl-sulfate reductase [Verrucomicrobia bacterium]|nr:phosphoadenylyl-sulfate reductase [Verrucomicrobiota bacterium]
MLEISLTSNPAANLGFDLRETNSRLERASASERLAWASGQFGSGLVLSSSFGAQAAVMLHLATRERSDIPVIFVDTGYLFPETYEFAERLAKRLAVKLKVYRSRRSPAWQEAIDGKRWEQGVGGIEAYNAENKVEPMNRALDELQATAWLAGLRRQQSASREKLPVLALAKGRVKVHPIIDWTDKNVHDYLKANDLPYHPLWEQGYISIGDMHTTRRLEDGMSEEETRFFGLKRECGLHEGTDTDFAI